MHQLITTYLFQQKQCPLLNYGHLYIDRTAAEPNFLNKQIEAPKINICFSESKIYADHFIGYVALQKNITFENATSEVDNFMQYFFASPQNKLNGIGTFNKNEDDKITFESISFSTLLSPAAKAERVIHEAAEHSMLVGDKETTNSQMTEYFSETETVVDRWWIWAIVLGLLGIAVIAYYYLIENQF